MSGSSAHYLTELTGWLRQAAAQLRARRQFSAVALTEVAGDIAADVVRESHLDAQLAQRAESHDREAVRILDEVLADGVVNRAEIPALRRARTLVHRSAAADRALGQRTRLTS